MMLETKPTMVKMFFIPIDKFEYVNDNDPECNEKIFAQICQHDATAQSLASLALQFTIIDCMVTHDEHMEISHIAAVVALWLEDEDAVLSTLQGWDQII